MEHKLFSANKNHHLDTTSASNSPELLGACKRRLVLQISIVFASTVTSFIFLRLCQKSNFHFRKTKPFCVWIGLNIWILFVRLLAPSQKCKEKNWVGTEVGWFQAWYSYLELPLKRRSSSMRCYRQEGTGREPWEMSWEGTLCLGAVCFWRPAGAKEIFCFPSIAVQVSHHL